MVRRPTTATRTDTLSPYSTLSRALGQAGVDAGRGRRSASPRRRTSRHRVGRREQGRAAAVDGTISARTGARRQAHATDRRRRAESRHLGARRAADALELSARRPFAAPDIPARPARIPPDALPIADARTIAPARDRDAPPDRKSTRLN